MRFSLLSIAYYSILLLPGCSIPGSDPGTCQPGLADASALPRHDSVFYFPVADSLYLISSEEEQAYTQRPYFSMLSKNLAGFQAPVLSGVTLPGETYRALRVGGFALPRLYTFRKRPGCSPSLTVQVINHHGGIRLAPPPPPPRGADGKLFTTDTTTTPGERAFNWRMQRPPLVEYVCTTPFPAEKWPAVQHYFAPFHAGRPVQADDFYCCDGVGWLLEAQTPQGYWFAYRREQGPPREQLFGWLEHQAPLPAGY